MTSSQQSPLRINLMIFATGLGALMAALAQTLVIPVVPEIGADLGASTSDAQWLITATLLAAAAAVPVVTRLADMFGRRRMLVVSLGALAAGSLIDALTQNLSLMIVGRAMAGLSAAAIPLGISLLAANLPPERKGSATALISAMLGVGGALGLPLAGLIADNFDYTVLFWVVFAGAAISLVLVRVMITESEVKGGSFDLLGAVLLSTGLVCFVLPLSQSADWGWLSTPTIALLLAAAALLSIFFLVERRIANPLVDTKALANPPVALTNCASVFVGFALFATFVGTTNYVQAPEATGYGFGSSVLTAGLCLLPGGLLMLAFSPVAAKMISRFGGGMVLSLAGVILAVGLIERVVLTDALWQIILGSSIVGLGTGIGYASLPSLINAHTPAEDLAAANGINSLARSLGSSLASAVGGSLLAAITITLGTAEVPSLTAYRVLFAICAGAALIAAAIGAILHARSVSAATSTGGDSSGRGSSLEVAPGV